MNDQEAAAKAFRNENLLSKADLLASFQAHMSYVKGGEDGEIPEGITKRRIELYRKFMKKIMACKLPTLSNLWWFYEYEFCEDCIELNLCLAEGAELDKNGNLTYSYSVDKTILKQECTLLTVDEFAKDWGVKPATVQQWIQRGRLRTAKKVEEDWFIPELQNKPGRGYQAACYFLDEAYSIEIPAFPLVSVSNMVIIFQNKNKKRDFTAEFINSQAGFRKDMTLSREEVEALEYALISSGKTSQGSQTQLIPWFDHSEG